MDVIWHILPSVSPLTLPLQPTETGPQLAARAVEAGAYVAIAHPNWYALTESDALSFIGLGAVHAIEQTIGNMSAPRLHLVHALTESLMA